jgi:hypothetical protein
MIARNLTDSNSFLYGNDEENSGDAESIVSDQGQFHSSSLVQYHSSPLWRCTKSLLYIRRNTLRRWFWSIKQKTGRFMAQPTEIAGEIGETPGRANSSSKM